MGGRVEEHPHQDKGEEEKENGMEGLWRGNLEGGCYLKCI